MMLFYANKLPIFKSTSRWVWQNAQRFRPAPNVPEALARITCERGSIRAVISWIALTDEICRAENGVRVSHRVIVELEVLVGAASRGRRQRQQRRRRRRKRPPSPSHRRARGQDSHARPGPARRTLPPRRRLSPRQPRRSLRLYYCLLKFCLWEDAHTKTSICYE